MAHLQIVYPLDVPVVTFAPLHVQTPFAQTPFITPPVSHAFLAFASPESSPPSLSPPVLDSHVIVVVFHVPLQASYLLFVLLLTHHWVPFTVIVFKLHLQPDIIVSSKHDISGTTHSLPFHVPLFEHTHAESDNSKPLDELHEHVPLAFHVPPLRWHNFFSVTPFCTSSTH